MALTYTSPSTSASRVAYGSIVKDKMMAYMPSSASMTSSPTARSVCTETTTGHLAKFTGVLCSGRRRNASIKISAGLFHDPSTEPGYYHVEKVYGAPIGKRLKLWNLPPNCKEKEIVEWFRNVGVTVQSVEFTNDPELNAQGIGGFVELESKWDCCKAIVKLDGYKLKGNCIRMDFVEKAPFPPGHNKGGRTGYGGKNNMNSSWNNVTSYPSVLDSQMNAKTAPVYGASSGYSNNKATGRAHSSPTVSTSQKVSTSSSPVSNSNNNRVSSVRRQHSSNNNQKTFMSSTSASSSQKQSSANPQFVNKDIGNNSGYDGAEQTSKNPNSQGNGVAFDYSQVSDLTGSMPSMKNLNYDEMDDADRVKYFEQGKITRTGPMYGSPQPMSLNRLFVGHLPSAIDEGSLQQLFSTYGTVLEARILRDMESGKSRGIGVVAMSTLDEMKHAARGLNGSQVQGHNVKVNAIC